MFFGNKHDVDTVTITKELLMELLENKKQLEAVRYKKDTPVVCELLSRTNDTGLGKYYTPTEFLDKVQGNRDVIVESKELRELILEYRALYSNLTSKIKEVKELKQTISELRSEVRFKSAALDLVETHNANIETAVNDALSNKANSEVRVTGLSSYIHSITNILKGEQFDETH